jgi:AraC-like DNA-binding protein
MSVETLSAKMGMSRAQLYRKLSSLTGRSVNEHLNALRLEKAKELLKAGGLNISEVAYEVGFNDPKYFGRVFSEAFGQSPSEFAGRR